VRLAPSIGKMQETFQDLSFRNMLPDDRNSAIVVTFQLGITSDVAQAHLNVLLPLFSAGAFDVLRTEKQLGYIVKARGRRLINELVVEIFVQSGKYSSEEIFKEIMAFVKR
jgi:secreted Zn-dependent insulinase-like peptidase